MPYLSFRHSKIVGISACVPQKIIYTKDFAGFTNEEMKQFVDITGVEQRHVALGDITTADLCIKAAEALIKGMGISLQDIGVLLFVSQSRDYFLPHTSAIIQDRMNLPQSCMSVDISLGCSGYVYGLSIMNGLLENSDSKYGLLLAGDISTRSTPSSDKSTFPLFGDAGTATLVKKSSSEVISVFNLENDGSRHEAIIIRHGMMKHFFTQESLIKKQISKGIERSLMDLELNGVEVFRFSITEVPPNIKTILKKSNLTVDDIDFVVFHQANKLIIQTISKVLKIPECKVLFNIQKYGNTSSASIPLCLVTELREPLRNNKLKLLFSSFGVGLSWGSALIETNQIHVADLQYL